MNPGDDILIRVAGTIALQQFNLHVIERIEIRKTVVDRAREQRIGIFEGRLNGVGEPAARMQ